MGGDECDEMERDDEAMKAIMHMSPHCIGYLKRLKTTPGVVILNSFIALHHEVTLPPPIIHYHHLNIVDLNP